MVGDVRGSAGYLRSLPGASGKVGVIGYCSGGRQSFLSACRLELDAAVDCYGGAVVHGSAASLPVKMPAVAGMAGDLSCPLLG